jgi:hypothetical protein
VIRSFGSVVVALGSLAALASAPACSDHDRPILKNEPQRPRRVIEPPSRGVRALPPHAIRADGVGPYKLGALAADLLDQLPSGPRIRQFTIPGIVHRDMLRGEDDAILIGTEPQGRAMFVAVVRAEIARTETGIQVGSTRDELEQALGPPVESADRARDPRIVIPSKLDNAHIVVDKDLITAIVLTPPGERLKDQPPEGKEPKEHPCTRPPADRARNLVGTCLTAAGEMLRSGDDEITLLSRDGEKPLAPTLRVPGLAFAAPLRSPLDGRDDLIAIVQSATEEARTWSLVAYRLIDGKLMRLIEPYPLYVLTAAHARWVGADLSDLDLLLELSARPDSYEATGLLATRVGASIRDIVVISPNQAPRRRVKPPPVEPQGSGSDAGSPDAQGSAHAERPTR